MKLKLLILVLALQCAWLLGTTFQQERALRVGRTIMLETAPVDPRDLLRGDYLILNYKISTVSANLFSPPLEADLPQGTTVWVTLALSTNQFHAVTRASTVKFAPEANEILVRSKSMSPRRSSTDSIRLEYSLEKYFVAEGTGNPSGKLTVQAAVSASGRALIKQVFLNGQPYAEAMKNSAH